MDTTDLAKFGIISANLGRNIMDQVQDALNGEIENINPEAIRIAIERFRRFPSFVKRLEGWFHDQGINP